MGEHNTLTVIITVDMIEIQEGALLSMLKVQRKAIGWTITDIKEIILFTVQYRIHLLGDARRTRDSQHRLNLVMKKAMRIDILK